MKFDTSSSATDHSAIRPYPWFAMKDKPPALPQNGAAIDDRVLAERWISRNE